MTMKCPEVKPVFFLLERVNCVVQSLVLAASLLKFNVIEQSHCIMYTNTKYFALKYNLLYLNLCEYLCIPVYQFLQTSLVTLLVSPT